MPLADEILSGDLYIKLSSDGGTTYDAVGVAKGAEISFDFPNIDVSSQGSGGYVKRKPGKRKSCTITVNGLMRFTDASGEINADDVFTLADDGTSVPWKFEPDTPGTGDVTWSGTGLINGLQLSAGDDASEASTSFTIESSGTFSKTVNS